MSKESWNKWRYLVEVQEKAQESSDEQICSRSQLGKRNAERIKIEKSLLLNRQKKMEVLKKMDYDKNIRNACQE